MNYAMRLPTEGFLESGSNPEYRYTADIHNGVVSITMWFNDKKHTLTTTDILRVAVVVHDYYHAHK
jgi:hypothetical protein